MSDGKSFLRLNGLERIRVSAHALEQICEKTGLALAREEARKVFLECAQLPPETVLMMGYRIAYGRRKGQGQESWYFLLPSRLGEMVAVVGRDDRSEPPCWATTLVPNEQTELFRVADQGAAVCRPMPFRRGRAQRANEGPRRARHGRARLREHVRVTDAQVPEIREFFAAAGGDPGTSPEPASPADSAPAADSEAA